MRYKILFFLLIISSFNSLNAQVIFNEDFENTFPPSNWTLINYAIGNSWEQGVAGTGLNGSHSLIQYTSSVASNAWIYTNGIPLTAGINYKLSYWYKIEGYQGKLKVVLANGIPANINATTVVTTLFDGSFVTNSTYKKEVDAFTVPSTGIYYFGLNCYSNPSSYALEVDSIVLEQTSGSACTGVPSIGTSTAVSTICPDSSFVLSMTGIAPVAGVGYQWQVSEVGQNNFSNIPGATTVNYKLSQKISKDYRCIATCSFSGLSSTSNLITVTSPAFCYCTPIGIDCTNYAIQNFTFGGINNTTGCSSKGYSDYTASVPAGSVAAGSTLPISVVFGNNLRDWVRVYIDFNKNGLMNEPGESFDLGFGDGIISSTITIPATAAPGINRMRVKTSKYPVSIDCINNELGEVEDYSINITPYICTGKPSVGRYSMVGPDYICNGALFTLTLSGSYSGNVFQWESSAVGANNFLPIPGATAQSYTTSQSISKDYRCKVSCVTSGLFTISEEKVVTTPVVCYCLPANDCIFSNFKITNVTFGTINNTTKDSCLYSGDFTTKVGPATVNAGSTVPIGVTVASAGTGSSVAVWIDYNKNGTFEPTEFTGVGSYNSGQTFMGSVFIPTNAVAGNTRMRVKRKVSGFLTSADACNNYDGETEDYTINIIAAPVAIYFTPFTDTLYNIVSTIRARIVQKDVGLNITDPLQPKLWVRKQGASTWKSIKGQLASGTANDGNWDFAINNDSLGIRRNGCDSVQFYFVAQDLNTAVNIGYLPEKGVSHSNVNTQISPPIIPFGYRLRPRLKDTIYVNSAGCWYKSLTDDNGLFHDIKTKRLEGNLTVLIESDLWESGLHELNKYGLNGFSITIKPADNVVKSIRGRAFDAILQLNNVKNVLIDGSYNGSGRYLKFQNLFSSPQLTDSSNVVVIKNSCDSITIKNAIFQQSVWLISPPTAGEATLYLKNSNKNIFILNNYFTNLDGFSLPMRHIASAAQNDNIIIRGNEFNNFSQYGIVTMGICHNWIIDGNHFFRTTVPNYYTYGYSAINIRGGGHTVSYNYIGGQAPFCAGAPMKFVDNPASSIVGIAVSGFLGNQKNIISNNMVDNITMGLTFAARAASFCGIIGGDNCIIKNNVIGNPKSTTPTIVPLASYIYGISGGGLGYTEVRDNIISNISNSPGSGPDYVVESMTAIAESGVAGRNNLANLPNVIAGNKIFNFRAVNSSSKTLVGIASSGGYNNIIENNILRDMSCQSGTLTGIQYSKGDSAGLTIIQKNRLYNFYNTAGATNGIGLEEVSNSVDILNNQVSIAKNDISGSNTISGIYENGPTFSRPYPNSKKRIIYNTVYIGGTGTSTGVSSGLLFNLGSEPLNREVYNNIIYNERTGGTAGNFGVRSFGDPQERALSNTRINHNYFVLADTSTFFSRSTYLNPSLIKSWAGWKSYVKADDSSYIDLPANVPLSRLFIDKPNGNLNINFADSICWVVNNKATPYNTIADDFDSLNIRSTSIVNGFTDIGSDEFSTNLPEPGSFCSGSGTFLSSNLTGGTYQWQQKVGSNFVDIANNANYSGVTTVKLVLTNVPFAWNGQQYRCVVNNSSLSQIFTIIVNERLTSTLLIATPLTNVCAGSNVTFTATTTNAGVTPFYQWKKNGQNTGTNSATYSTNSLASGDVITASLTTGLVCTTSPLTNSNAITMVVIPSLNTAATISGTIELSNANPNTLLSLTTVNPGANPTYQWQDSSDASGWQNIPGATNSTLHYTLMSTGIKVRCNVSSTNSCLGLNVAVSNTLTLNFKPDGGISFRYYPNPVRTVMTVDNLKLSEDWLSLEIINAYGAQKLIVVDLRNLTKVNINVTNLPAGIYFAILTQKSGVREYFKFVKL